MCTWLMALATSSAKAEASKAMPLSSASWTTSANKQTSLSANKSLNWLMSSDTRCGSQWRAGPYALCNSSGERRRRPKNAASCATARAYESLTKYPVRRSNSKPRIAKLVS